MKVDRVLLWLAMTAISCTSRRRLVAATKDVRTTQLELLRRITRENSQTEFGKAHDFAEIRSLEDFRRAVPVTTFDDLAPAVDRQMRLGVPALTRDPPIFYARTSGTSSRAKDIPMTRAGERQLKEAQRLMALTLYRQTGFFDGRILGIGSPPVEGQTESGISYGAASGQAYAKSSWLTRTRFVAPAEVFAIADYEKRYKVLALLALLEPDLTGIATANPSTVQRLIEIVNSHRRLLAAALSSGCLDGEVVPPGIAALIAARTKASPTRARAVRFSLEQPEPLTIRDLWPRLAAIVVWTGGSCGFAIDRLKQMLPAHTRVVELGYRSSEFIGTINVDAEENLCVPSLHHTLFEFVERADRESGCWEFKTLENLEAGRDYYVFATTQNGLYRYDINDIVRAGRRFNDCPTLRFLRKGSGMTSITGEKLTEDQVLQALRDASAGLGVQLAFFVLLADEAAARYRLLFEPADGAEIDSKLLAETLDRQLRRGNIEYDEKRASARLGVVQGSLVKAGYGEACKGAALARGERESQYKPRVLEYLAAWPQYSGQLDEEAVTP
jgi:hypothetical protein